MLIKENSTACSLAVEFSSISPETAVFARVFSPIPVEKSVDNVDNSCGESGYFLL